MGRRSTWILGLAGLVCGAQLAFAGAASAADTLYWSNYSDNTISSIPLAGSGAASTFVSVGSGPAGASGVAFDTAGNLFVANEDHNTVSKVTPGGVVSAFAAGFSFPTALAFDRSGNLYVANYNANSVSVVSTAGVVSTFVPANGGFSGPDGLAFDAAGNLYVANETGNTVSKVTPAGVVSTFASGFSEPIGLVFDAAGDLYVVNHNSGHTVSKVTPAGVVSNFSAGPGIANAIGVAIDAAGNLYVAAGYSQSISKITPAGVVSTFLSRATDPFFLAVADVPVGVRTPIVTGTGKVRAPLLCSTAAWAPDPPGGLLFQQPISTAFGWQLNGTAISGANGSSFTPTQPGSYTCTSTGSNQAGATTQTSTALKVLGANGPGGPSVSKVKISKVKINPKHHTAAFSFKATGKATGFQCALVKLNTGKRRQKPHFASCKSPKTYKHLKAGKYTFEVRALSRAGAGSLTKRGFQI